MLHVLNVSNASQHVPIYLQPFLRYSIFTPHLCLAAPQGVTPSEFREDLDTHKTRMNGISCDEESMTIYSAVLIQYQRVTDGQRDGQTDGRPAAYIYTVSGKKVKNCIRFHNSGKQCRILAKFCSNNATSNCKQNAKFQ